MSNLSTVIKSIQDVMRQDSGVDGDAQRISQLTWLLFLKVFDAQEEELELTRDAYKSPIPEHLRWRNWAADAEGVTGEALLDFVNVQLFPKLKALPGDAERNPRGFVVRSVFEDAYNYMKSGQLLRQVVNKLNAIDFNRQTERHQFNDLYEKILRDLQSAGNAGEFYTPRAVTQFMVDMVNPRLGEVVFDPACGTGGFLVCTLEHLRQQVKNEQDQATLQRSVRGVEKKQLPHMLCTTNMMLHGVEVLFAQASRVIGGECKYLVSCGFSFSDEHINQAVLLPALRSGRCRLTALCDVEPAGLADFKPLPTVSAAFSTHAWSNLAATPDTTDLWRFSQFAAAF